MTTRRFRLLASTVLLGLAASASAHADGDKTGTKAAADALFRAGREAVNRGDFETGCAKFKESLKLDPATGTLLNLAKCDERAGDLAGALERLESIAPRLKPDDDRSGVVMQMTMALERRVGRLTVTLEPGSPEGATLLVDGTAMTSGATKRVNPGAHTLVARAPSHADREFAVTIAEGESRELTLSPGATQAKEGAPEAATTAPAKKKDARGASGQRIASYALLGVGAAALATGGVLGYLALNRKKDALDHCDASQACDPQGLDAANKFRTFSRLSTYTVIGGAALATGGLVLLLTDKPKSERAATVGASVVPGGAFVTARGTF